MPDVLGAIFKDTGRPVDVPVGIIKTDGGTQMRAGTDDATVFEYGQAMIQANGWGSFPAVVAYHDGKDYWLADGFHRVAAFLESFPDPKRVIPVEVRAGTRRDAVLHAAGANASHGLRRTNADKRRSVETLLRDEEWRQWSDTEIAKRCAVSQNFVSSVRRDLTQIGFESPAIRKGADGRTINTANIGKPAPLPVPAPVLNTPPAASDDGYDADRVTQPIVYTFEDVVRIGGDHIRRGVAARKPEDEAIEHPLDCYEDPEYEAKWHEVGGEPIDIAAMVKEDMETLDRLKWPRMMRDMYELQQWFKQTREEKSKEFTKLTGREVPAVLGVALTRLIDILTEAMDTLETSLDATVEVTNANQ